MKMKKRAFTAEELEKMINDYISYYQNPLGRSDIEAEAADRLVNNCLPIAQHLLMLLKQ